MSVANASNGGLNGQKAKSLSATLTAGLGYLKSTDVSGTTGSPVISTTTIYTIYKFNSTGSITFSSFGYADIVAVGGGGGGGAAYGTGYGAGGGGGAIVTLTDYFFPKGSTPIIVGAGGGGGGGYGAAGAAGGGAYTTINFARAGGGYGGGGGGGSQGGTGIRGTDLGSGPASGTINSITGTSITYGVSNTTTTVNSGNGGTGGAPKPGGPPNGNPGITGADGVFIIRVLT